MSTLVPHSNNFPYAVAFYGCIFYCKMSAVAVSQLTAFWLNIQCHEDCLKLLGLNLGLFFLKEPL